MSLRKFTLCCYSFVPYPHDDPNPQFALGADVYAQIPSDMAKKYKDDNHALAIWLDIATQEWVVRKEYNKRQIRTIKQGNMSGILLTSGKTIAFVEVYRGKDFQKALDQCTILQNKYWGSETKWTKCTHVYESHCCKKYKDRYAWKN